MPIWIVIMILGAAGSGWAILKARGMEERATLKKVKEGSKDIKSAAITTARRPVEQEPDRDEPVATEESLQFSRDATTQVVRDIEEYLHQ